MKYEILLPQTIHEMGQRDNQEDSIFPSEEQASVDNRLFILCDGMGGHESGEVASQTVCQALSDYIRQNLNAPATPCPTVADGVRTAIDKAGPDGVVCACGSLYMIGEIVAALDQLKAEGRIE
jgi:serine/threonine protein phosphatase PrpC